VKRFILFYKRLKDPLSILI